MQEGLMVQSQLDVGPQVKLVGLARSWLSLLG